MALLGCGQAGGRDGKFFLCRNAFSKGGCDCQPGQEGLLPAPGSMDRRVRDLGDVKSWISSAFPGRSSNQGKISWKRSPYPLTCGFGGD